MANLSEARPPITVEWIGGPDDGLQLQMPWNTKSFVVRELDRTAQRKPGEPIPYIEYKIPVTKGRRGQPVLRWQDRERVDG